MQAVVRGMGAVIGLVAVLAASASGAIAAPGAVPAPRFPSIGGVVRLIAPGGVPAPLGGHVIRGLPDGTEAIDVPASRAAGAYADLVGRYGPRAVRPDTVARSEADHIPSDPLWPDMWWAKTIGMPAAWGVSLGSRDVVIAILDTGVNEAADLAGALLPGAVFLEGATDTTDPEGHGTAVAQVAAGRIDNGLGGAGVCPRCSILPVKMAGTNGAAWTSDEDAAIVWAVDHGATVINISFGSTDSGGMHDAAVRYARSAGVSVVAAAGNEGDAATQYPAGAPGVISVAGTDEHDALASWSTRGPWVDLAAPGVVPTATTRPDGVILDSGTSFSAPMVAGALGLLASAVPGSTMAEREAALASTAVPVSPAGSIGGGRIDVAAALTALAAAVPQPTQPTAPVVGAPVVVMTEPARAVTFTHAAAVDLAWTETLVPGETASSRTVTEESTPVVDGVCDGTAWADSGQDAAPSGPAFQSGLLADRTCYRWRIHVVDGSGRVGDAVGGVVMVDRGKPAVRAVLPKRLTSTTASTVRFRWTLDDGTTGSGVTKTTIAAEVGRLAPGGCGHWVRASKHVFPFALTEDRFAVRGSICVRLRVTASDAAGNTTTVLLPAYRHP